jgi:3-methylcrotonyl-CoA carboxylase alpha subunit
MIGSLLIANRGEIACRIIRTAGAMGIRTVAVYSDADANALHVRQADDAVHIGASPPADSYLRGERIIAAARETGAEAIHPGYGFLSENADFAQAVIDAGLVWVGPNPASIRAMGRKDAAKRLMQGAGVPTTPGYLGEDQSAERLFAEAEAIGWPVLIKAVAGGGGKGMRRVDAAADFAEALAAAQREGASSFGDGRVLLEKYVLSPRHIEVQVFGDTHGNVVHLFERDCSLQRRHQKVIEEAPAPGMDEATRAVLCDAAVKAARAVDYVGAGTIEFIADASDGLRADRIWFMEMNTRLQVEHPVTEAITGVDLVEWQLRVASGEPLPRRQEELAIDGHAIEARLYAEDPANGFRPSAGRIDHLDMPPALRIESGVEPGDAISAFYDPMIAKLIAAGATRDDALADLTAACAHIECEPVRTNAWFLRRLLAEPDFIAGGVTTGFIADHLESLTAAPVPSDALLQQAANDLVFGGRYGFDARNDPHRAFLAAKAGFRLNAAPNPLVRLRIDGEAVAVTRDPAGTSWHDVRGKVWRGDDIVYFEDGAAFVASQDRPHAARAAEGGDGAVVAPMPGRITAVAVAVGDSVAAGQMLVTLEAMKMEQALVAPFDGRVDELSVAAGDQVDEGRVLARVGKVKE